MTFRDFVAVTRPELTPPDPMDPTALQGEQARRSLETVRFDVDAYDLAWQDYLTCGGFPRAVAEHRRLGRVSDDYFRDLAAWLRGDINLDGPAQSLPLLLGELGQRASSPLNLTNLADTLSWTRRTTESRVHRLVASFGALWCRQHDRHGHQVSGSQPKLYLLDPALAWLPSHQRAGLPSPDMTRLTEQVLGVALARTIDSLEEGRLVAGDTIGYMRTESGNEVDFAPVEVPLPGAIRRTVPLEAKWVDAGWRAEAKVIENKYGHGLVATKSILDLDHPSWAVPAPLVALLLG